MFHIANHAQTPVVLKRFPYHPVNDFSFIGKFGTTALPWCVRADVPVHSMREFRDYARGKGLNYGTYSPGSSGHAFGQVISDHDKLDMTAVHYRGEAPMLADVLGGRIPCAFHSMTGSGEAPVISGRDVNYPDQVVCLFASGAMVAALLERDRTGQGAHLDLSQRVLTSFLLGEELLVAAAGAPSARRGNADPLAPADRVVADGEGWRAEWAGGSAPVRDGYALAEAAEFKAGTAVQRAPDGKPAKGIPFRFTCRPLAITDSCHMLGADNAAVLAASGYDAGFIASLEQPGVLATEPRGKRHE